MARKLAVGYTKLVCLSASFSSYVCLTASFLATVGFKFIISKCIHGLQACLFENITVAAFSLYALRGEDAAKKGGWRH